ncbi:MAG: PQQ-binding-like beta-propeller repeat protein [Verrucomicrobiales bacterium]
MSGVWIYTFALACLLFPATSCSRKLKSGTAKIDAQGADKDPPSSARADEWLGHLGSHRNGHSGDVNLRQDWLEKEPELLWRTELGKGVAGVAVADGRVLGIGNTGSTDTVYCLHAANGAEMWSTSYHCPLGKRMFEGGPAATPTIDAAARRVYVLSHEGELRCLSMADGVELWMRHYVKDLGGRMPEYGFAAAPFLGDGVLIVQPGGERGSVVALDPETGERRWSAGSDASSYSAPIGFEHGGRKMVAVFNSYGLAMYSLIRGQELGRVRWQTRYNINAATPCYFAGHIFIISGYGKGGALIALHGEGGELVYETRDVVCQFQSPVRAGEFLYMVSGDNSTRARLCCVRFDNGDVKWSEPMGGNRGNVILSGDKLIAVSEKGEALLCDATPAGFIDRGRFQALGGRCWAPPAIAEGKLYVRNNAGRLACINLR